MMTLRYRGHEFHGKLKSLGEKELVAEFYDAEGLPVVLDTIEFDLECQPRVFNIVRLPGFISDSVSGRNLMGRDFFTFSIKYGKLTEADKVSIKQFVESVPPPAPAEGE